jgi:hypothetical protein
MRAVTLSRGRDGQLVFWHDAGQTITLTYPDGKGEPVHKAILSGVETWIPDFETAVEVEVEEPKEEPKQEPKQVTPRSRTKTKSKSTEDKTNGS